MGQIYLTTLKIVLSINKLRRVNDLHNVKYNNAPTLLFIFLDHHADSGPHVKNLCY